MTISRVYSKPKILILLACYHMRPPMAKSSIIIVVTLKEIILMTSNCMHFLLSSNKFGQKRKWVCTRLNSGSLFLVTAWDRKRVSDSLQQFLAFEHEYIMSAGHRSLKKKLGFPFRGERREEGFVFHLFQPASVLHPGNQTPPPWAETCRRKVDAFSRQRKGQRHMAELK